MPIAPSVNLLHLKFGLTPTETPDRSPETPVAHDLSAVVADPITVAKFWRKVGKDRGPVHPTLGRCWLWTGIIDAYGYGLFPHRGRNLRSHRVAFTLVKGQIPTGTEPDHLCRNRACPNPDHLEAVPHQVNLRRSPITLATIHASRTTCPQGHPYAGSNLYINSRGSRACKACWRLTAEDKERLRQRPLTGGRPSRRAMAVTP